MTSLAELQQQIRAAVFEAGKDDAALATASELIEADERMPASEQLLLYRHAILATLVRALEAIYPVCRQLVGDEFYSAMCRVYARGYPSESPDLGDYGAHFADFIGTFEPAASLNYLPEVARLEWAWHRAFHAADEAGLDIAALERVTVEDNGRILFRLPMSASLLTADFPVQTIWQVNQPDWTGASEVDLAAGGCQLMVWRRGHEMRIDEPESSAWHLLRAIADGLTLEQIGREVTNENLDSVLPACVQRGWIAGFELVSPKL